MIQFIRGLFILLAFGMALFSCQKIEEGRIPPVIVLNGRNPDTVLKGCSYTDPGAFYTDDYGTKVAQVKGMVNTDSAGTYFLDYLAYDADSNMSVESRRVVVEPLNDNYFLGNYTVSDTLVVIPRQVSVYSAFIEMQDPNQGIFRISNFGNFGNEFRVLIQPDSAGNFQLNYDDPETIIQGEGWVKCDSRGLRMTYTIEILPDEFETHKVTYDN